MENSGKELPEIVYHYTSMDTLTKIVHTDTLWATNISYLNDVKERNFFVERVMSRSSAFADAHGLPHGLFDQFYEAEAEELGAEDLPYVVSFSKYENSLPQWRAYCQQGNGVSIGFKVSYLSRAKAITHGDETSFDALEPWCTFAPIRYVDELDNALIDEILSSCFDSALKKHQDDDEITFGLTLEERFSRELRDTASFVKHKSFEAEGEYRLLVNGIWRYSSLIQARASRTTLVPYISLPLPSGEGDEEPSSPICKIVLGPCPNPSLSIKALSLYLRSRIPECDIFDSESPYREL